MDLHRYSAFDVEITGLADVRAPESNEWVLPFVVAREEDLSFDVLMAFWLRQTLDERDDMAQPHDHAAVRAAIERFGVAQRRMTQARLNKVPWDEDHGGVPDVDTLCAALFIVDNEYDGPFCMAESENGTDIFRGADIYGGAALVTVLYQPDETHDEHTARALEVVRGMTWALRNPA